jgi:hypothetical protein
MTDKHEKRLVTTALFTDEALAGMTDGLLLRLKSVSMRRGTFYDVERVTGALEARKGDGA